MANEKFYENNPDVLADISLIRAVGWNPDSLGVPFGPWLLAQAIEDDFIVKERTRDGELSAIAIINKMNEWERIELRTRLETSQQAQVVLDQYPDVARRR